MRQRSPWLHSTLETKIRPSRSSFPPAETNKKGALLRFRYRAAPSFPGDRPWNLRQIRPVCITELGDQPFFPMERAQVQVDRDEEVEHKKICGHEGSKPDDEKAREEERVPYPAIDSPYGEILSVLSVRSCKLERHFEPVGRIRKGTE